MEAVEKVNFHYEYQLANIQLPPAQIEKINREYEYMALLWGDVKALANYQKYTAGYLKQCERFNIDLPLLKNDHTTYDNFFWGDTSHEYVNLNSKKTSSQIAASIGLDQKDRIIHGLSDLKNFLDEPREINYIIRTDFSVSGRGVFILRPEDGPNAFLKRLEKELKGQAMIVSPYLNRLKDFSVIMSRDGDDIIYETVVDPRGKFCGVLLDHEKMNSLDKWMTDEDVKIYQDIFRGYQSLGAEKIQVDSFYYNDGGGVKIFHLAEVNVRKTMGEVAYRLYKRNFSSSPYFSFSLLSQAQKKKKNLQYISPETSQHGLLVSEHNDEKKARCFFE